MTWFEIFKAPTLQQGATDPRILARMIQKTGYCPRCQRMVRKYEACPLNLPAPPVAPNCPMKGAEE